MIIKGERICLKSINEDDTDLIIKWRNNPRVRENFIFQEKFTEKIHNDWLKNKVYTGDTAQFIIIEQKTNKPLGSVYLRDIDKINKKAEFGIFIGEDDFRGKGYGKEATSQIITYGFSQLKLNKIFLRVLENNAIAINSYIKSGFKKEGLFKEDVVIRDKHCDIVFMAMLKSDWRKMHE